MIFILHSCNLCYSFKFQQASTLILIASCSLKIGLIQRYPLKTFGQRNAECGCIELFDKLCGHVAQLSGNMMVHLYESKNDILSN